MFNLCNKVIKSVFFIRSLVFNTLFSISVTFVLKLVLVTKPVVSGIFFFNLCSMKYLIFSLCDQLLFTNIFNLLFYILFICNLMKSYLSCNVCLKHHHLQHFHRADQQEQFVIYLDLILS